MKKLLGITICLFLFCTLTAFSQQKIDTTGSNDSLIIFNTRPYMTELKVLESNFVYEEYMNSMAVCFKGKYYFGSESVKILKKISELNLGFNIIKDTKKILTETKKDNIRILIKVIDSDKEIEK